MRPSYPPHCYICAVITDIRICNQFGAHICKRCQNKKATRYRQTPSGKISIRKNKKKWVSEHRKEYREIQKVKQRMRRIRNPTLHKIATEKWHLKNMDKVKAHRKLYRAIRSGIIIKPNRCEACNTEIPKNLLRGHHEDYSKPLQINWLCSICHNKRHNETNTKSI